MLSFQTNAIKGSHSNPLRNCPTAPQARSVLPAAVTCPSLFIEHLFKLLFETCLLKVFPSLAEQSLLFLSQVSRMFKSHKSSGFDCSMSSFNRVRAFILAATWSHTVQHQLGYCQQAPHKVAWTSDAPKPAPYFNAGMFVFEPSSEIFQ
jgi:hypothetical protein